jgi:hypothetical protein
LLEHSSFGTFGTDWVDAQLYINEKWRNSLPIIIGQDDRTYKKCQVEAINAFLITSIKAHHERKKAFGFLSLLLLLKPLQKLNFYFIKNAIAYLAEPVLK